MLAQLRELERVPKPAQNTACSQRALLPETRVVNPLTISPNLKQSPLYTIKSVEFNANWVLTWELKPAVAASISVGRLVYFNQPAGAKASSAFSPPNHDHDTVLSLSRV